MSLKRAAFILAFFVACVCAAAAQESKCSLKLSELPAAAELRGFRLGMTTDEVRARLPKTQIRRADQFGFAALNVFPDYEAGIDKTSFEGVRSISLEFMDGRVSSLWVGYDQSFKWQTVEEFTAGIASALRLPSLWRSKFRTRLMDCADFTVSVVPVGESPSLKLVDETARELLEKRKAAQEGAQP